MESLGRGRGIYSFSRAAETKHHKLCGLNNSNLLLMALEARSLEEGLGGVGSS